VNAVRPRTDEAVARDQPVPPTLPIHGAQALGEQHRIVIVGGGAGGLELATRLGDDLGKRGKAQIILVERSRTHLWKPKLHEVAAGSMDVGQHELDFLAQSHWHHFHYRFGEMVGLDRARRLVHVAPTLDEDGHEITPARVVAYDTLVICVGSLTNDFHTPGAAQYAISLDVQEEAARFHRRLVNACLRANTQSGPLRPEQLQLAIIGAGATGVELAAELHRSMRVTEVRPNGVVLENGRVIPAELIVWAAGVKAPEFLAHLDGLEVNRINQLVVTPTLQTTRDENIFAFGDCASCPWLGKQRTVPPRAQAAHQQASHLYSGLRRRLKGRALKAYQYRDFGSLVSLGEYSTVGNLMGGLIGGSILIEGLFARFMYVSLYKQHELALHGFFKVALDTLARLITRRTEPHVKLH
jgi:NADH dehydrogenase